MEHENAQTATPGVLRPPAKADPFGRLMKIIRALEAAGIHFTVTRYRRDAVSIQATVPGERWEIDVTEGGDIDFERFVSAGPVAGKSELKRFIARFANPASEAPE